MMYSLNKNMKNLKITDNKKKRPKTAGKRTKQQVNQNGYAFQNQQFIDQQPSGYEEMDNQDEQLMQEQYLQY